MRPLYIYLFNVQYFDIWKKSDEKYDPGYVCHEENLMYLSDVLRLRNFQRCWSSSSN